MITPSHEMLTAGSRAIGRTMKYLNHYERAAEVFKCMMENYQDPKVIGEIPDASKLSEGPLK